MTQRELFGEEYKPTPASFYNTTHERGATLKEYESKASRQETVVLAYFRFTKSEHSPSEVHAACFEASVPLTSTRRALTHLTTRGLLMKLDTKRVGPFGRHEHLWTLRKVKTDA